MHNVINGMEPISSYCRLRCTHCTASQMIVYIYNVVLRDITTAGCTKAAINVGYLGVNGFAVCRDLHSYMSSSKDSRYKI